MTTPLSVVCVICCGPIEIGKVTYVDDENNPVHEPCYMELVTKKKPASSLGYFRSKYDSFAYQIRNVMS